MSQSRRLQRRQFLANILFGGAVTLAGLQGAQAAEHPADGWSLPDLGQTDPKPRPTPPPQPPPEPQGRKVPPKPPDLPQPPTAGVPAMPGQLTPTPPPSRGSVAPPKPAPER